MFEVDVSGSTDSEEERERRRGGGHVCLVIKPCSGWATAKGLPRSHVNILV